MTGYIGDKRKKVKNAKERFVKSVGMAAQGFAMSSEKATSKFARKPKKRSSIFS